MDIWTVTPTATWLGDIRGSLDSRTGTTHDYTDGVDAAWTYVYAEGAFQVDQHVAQAINGSLLANATRPVVVARAEDRGLSPRPASSSRYVVELTAGAGGALPVGTVLRVVTGPMLYRDPVTGVDLQMVTSEWEVVENTFPSEVIASGDTVTIQSLTEGEVLNVSSTVTFTPTSTLAGITTLTWESPLVRSFGRPAESTAELRARLRRERALAGGSPAGLVGAVRDLPWIVAVGLTEGIGEIAITVAPGPSTETESVQLAETIYRNKGGGITTLGDETETIEGVDGRDVDVHWDIGALETVAVVFTVTAAPGVSDADARAAAQANIAGAFSSLQPGEPILYLRAYGALNIPAVVSGTITLDGGTADVYPTTAADVLTPVFS